MKSIKVPQYDWSKLMPKQEIKPPIHLDLVKAKDQKKQLKPQKASRARRFINWYGRGK